ncbi:MAG: rhodanese-like domain-containing protein [Geobacteraceae bacterium]|nr:rhodanese-like domain-containing protein [Geobacteraceae bacterium]NTW81693.1 rhodanese-like domain-containing protein [Geobacteraceae bacterium]
MQAKELVQLIKSKKSPTVVDVRSGFEYRSGHVPGAIHAPTWKILLKIAKLPKDKNAKLVVLCEHGPRAQMAQGLLGLYGYSNVTLLDGNMAGWRRAGLPVEK